MPLLTSLKELVSGLTIREILEYYAMLCIILMPFAFGILIYLNKRTSAIKRLNEFLDRILGLKEEKTPSGNDKKEEKKNGNDDEKNAEDDNEKSGITHFKIFVGDIYYCRVNSADSTERTNTLSWTSTNRFIAQIEKKTGKLLARRNGNVQIVYIDENGYDQGRTLYNIDVVQTNPDWFADKAIGLLYKNASREEVANAFIGKKILSENKAKKTVIYEGLEDEKKIVFQFSAGNKLRRILWEFDSNIKEDEDGRFFSDELGQRFERVEGTGDVDIWIREFDDGSRDEVEYYAFVKKTSRKTVVLGIGKTWRDYGDVEEFLMNIPMCEKMFADCTGNEPVAKFTVDAEYARKKSVEAAREERLKNVTNVVEDPREPEETKPEQGESGHEEQDGNETETGDGSSPEPPAEHEGESGAPVDMNDIPDTGGSENEDEENEGAQEETPENPAEDVDFDDKKEMIEGAATPEDFDAMYKDYDNENDE